MTYFCFREGKLVAVFKLSVGLIFDLNGVVGQMNSLVTHGLLVQGICIGTQADVALLKKKALVILVDQNPNSNVEFSVFYQKWPLNILLHND